MMETLVPLFFAYLTVFAFGKICPFPGIPKNGYGTDGHSEYLNWSVRQNFNENDVIQYKCEEGWATSWAKEAIRCQSDGTWNATVPKCEITMSETDWKKVIFTLHREKTKNETKESLDCSKTYSYIQLHPRSRLLNITNIREIHTEFCPKTSGQGLVVHVAALSGFNKSCNQIYETLNKKIFSCNFSDSAIRDEPIGFIEIDNTERQFMLKSVRLLVQSGDYCGFPAVPINGKMKYLSATECDYECSNGFALRGGNRSTCNPVTGQWSPLPVCHSCWSTVQVPFLCDRRNFYVIEGLLTATFTCCLVCLIFVNRQNRTVERANGAAARNIKK